MPARRKIFGLLFIFIFLFLLRPNFCYGANLLNNWGFEEGDSGWSKYGSTQLDIVDNDLNDSKAGALTSSKSGAKYIYQEFDVVEGEEFQLWGWIKWNDDFISNAKLRVEWYDDSSSSPIGRDEISLAFKDEEWQYLAGNLKALPLSKKAKFEAYAYFNKVNPSEPVLFDDLFFGSTDQLSPTPTPEPTEMPTSTPTQSPTDAPAASNTPTPVDNPEPTATPTEISTATTATYKINEVKNEEGDTLSSVKIYVDGGYVHHYAPETLELCEGCYCYDENDEQVSCGFGEHTIKLEKSGYQDWTETETINTGDSYEVDPVMALSSDSSPSSTPTPTSTPAPTLTKTPTPTKKLSLTPTPDVFGDVLGATEAGSSDFLEKNGDKEDSDLKPPVLWPKLLIGLGLMLIFGAAYPLWLPKLKIVYNQIKRNKQSL